MRIFLKAQHRSTKSSFGSIFLKQEGEKISYDFPEVPDRYLQLLQYIYYDKVRKLAGYYKVEELKDEYVYEE